ncbi:glycosyltransferase family 2 protein [Phaeodactylibacter luteus]|uniref:Glycosyltransferase n=1 Tax=Phaeodactylibacter luteus TaxID=1564516 RepID=A0A5C6S318_9BACT|nr:glycosyltransferase [Phaeodactylibacter luteus]TXB68855.1 glycosyltransferase [Phaeodactylibacter luteus]
MEKEAWQKGISVLVPVYNYDVRTFLCGLRDQATSCPFPVEVFALDDGSGEHWKAINSDMRAEKGIRWEELPANVGRSRIRNIMAQRASCPYLLFLDGDGGLARTDFLQCYAAHLQPAAVLYGGRVYEREPPADPALLFHWRYGAERESMSVAARKARPYHAFMTNNFLIPRDIALRFPFDESLEGYGHEDTRFGAQLRDAGIAVIHLDNPVAHLGLEPAAVFLEKTRQGVANLRKLIGRGERVSTRLSNLGAKVESWGAGRLSAAVLKILEPSLERWLCTGRAPMWAFDLYKLGLWLNTRF